MASFAEIENVEPDLADRVRAVPVVDNECGTGHEPGVMVRRDWSAAPIRTSTTARCASGRCRGPGRARHLRRDPRVAVHSIPWDSRPLRDGATNVGAATDAKVSGTAALTTDAGKVSEFACLVEVRARASRRPGTGDLFTIDIDALTVISADAGQLVVDRWSITDGRRNDRPVPGVLHSPSDTSLPSLRGRRLRTLMTILPRGCPCSR